MKKYLILSAVAIVVIALILLRIFTGGGAKSGPAGPVKQPAVPVEAYVVRDTSVVYQVATIGSLRANENVDIVSEISRKIVSIPLKEGSTVAKGDLLFKLDDSDITARIGKLTVEEKLAETNEARQKVQLASGGLSQEKYDATLSHLNLLRAEIAILKVDLSKTEIRAPFAGRIGLRNFSEGALVTPGTPLARLQDVSRIKIDFSVPERYANDLRTGAAISFTTDYSVKTYTGIIEAVEPDVEKATRTISLRAVCGNSDGSLVPGASVKVSIDIRSLSKRLFIPSPALIASIRGYDVFLVQSGKAVLRPVKTGIRNRFSVEVTDGLAPGDTVVVTNLLRIKPDSPVKIVKFD